MITDLKDLAECEHQAYITKLKFRYALELHASFDGVGTVARLSEDECENLATFCRSFLHAWEFAQKQESQQND